MRKVNVSTFKAKISAYLRSVRKGHKYLILERNVPVAVVSPNESAELEIVDPQTSLMPIVKALLSSDSFENVPKSLKLLRSDRDQR